MKRKSLYRRLTENIIAQGLRNSMTRFKMWRDTHKFRFETWLEKKSPFVPRRIHNKLIDRVNKNADYRISEFKKENDKERGQLGEMISRYYRVGIERPSAERYRVSVELDTRILFGVRGGLHEEIHYLAYTIGRQIERELSSINFSRAISESRYDENYRRISWVDRSAAPSGEGAGE